MPIPAVLKDRLRLPVIASPTRIISNPDLVIAQCKAGVVGSFPALNARPPELLDQWLTRIQEEAVDKGAEGLIAVAAGAGGHAGTQSPMALIQEIRQWWDGPLALSGAIATGRSVLMAQVMKPGVHRHTRGQRRRRRQGNDRRVGGRGHRLHQPRHRDARQLDRADADPAIRAVMFSDNGDCFTTGIDLGDFLANPPTIGDGPVGHFIRALAGARKVLWPLCMARRPASARPCCCIATWSSPPTAPACRCPSSSWACCPRLEARCCCRACGRPRDRAGYPCGAAARSSA